MDNNDRIKKERFRRVVLKNVDKFNGINNREDAEFFLSNIFIEGDIYITFNKRKKIIFNKDSDGKTCWYVYRFNGKETIKTSYENWNSINMLYRFKKIVNIRISSIIKHEYSNK